MSAHSEPQFSLAQEKGSAPVEETSIEPPPLEEVRKGRWERSWPTIACGAGLFSDGYLNGVSVPGVPGTQTRHID